MPKLVRLYIHHVLIGFALSAVFIALLLVLNIGNLWHLISTSPVGWVAIFILFVCNGSVFAGVQFGWAVMRVGREDEPSGGHRQRLGKKVPVLVPLRVQDDPSRPKAG